jgi:hypothetical protein
MRSRRRAGRPSATAARRARVAKKKLPDFILKAKAKKAAKGKKKGK